MPRNFTIPEIVETYRVSRSTVYQALKNGRLGAIKVGRRTLVSRDAAEQWMRSLPAYEPKVAA